VDPFVEVAPTELRKRRHDPAHLLIHGELRAFHQLLIRPDSLVLGQAETELLQGDCRLLGIDHRNWPCVRRRHGSFLTIRGHGTRRCSGCGGSRRNRSPIGAPAACQPAQPTALATDRPDRRVVPGRLGFECDRLFPAIVSREEDLAAIRGPAEGTAEEIWLAEDHAGCPAARLEQPQLEAGGEPRGVDQPFRLGDERRAEDRDRVPSRRIAGGRTGDSAFDWQDGPQTASLRRLSLIALPKPSALRTVRSCIGFGGRDDEFEQGGARLLVDR